jgi:hypothetical protein
MKPLLKAEMMYGLRVLRSLIIEDVNNGGLSKVEILDGSHPIFMFLGLT